MVVCGAQGGGLYFIITTTTTIVIIIFIFIFIIITITITTTIIIIIFIIITITTTIIIIIIIIGFFRFFKNRSVFSVSWFLLEAKLLFCYIIPHI